MKKVFKAEVSEMLNLVVNSLYSKKEIFLRELISNASDAIDRAKFAALTDKSIAADSPEWEITLAADKDAGTLTISDNGIGMSAADAEQNLGTIARSGTRAFLDSLKQGDNAPEMIGQFGVGFYAGFMVADEVKVETRKRSGEEAVVWCSKGDGEYTIEKSERETFGTSITLHLREDQKNFLEEWELKSLVKKYSDFIAYPIKFGGETLNTTKALWRRAKSDVKEEEYTEFYKHISHDYSAPLRTIHYNVEGVLEFRALLFIPEKPSFDLFMPDSKSGLQLYVRNVFIGSDFEELLPTWLRFVKGVVDSSDLPLNVSREMLQDDAIIRKIRSNLVGKIIAEIEEMKKDAENYEKFFKAFGRFIKEGVGSDYENAAKLKELLLFPHSAAEGLISLRKYCDAMPTEQEEIFFLRTTLGDSPFLDSYKKNGRDVLLMSDPIDEWLAPALDEYDGKKFRAIDSDDAPAADDAEFKPFLDFVKDSLKDDVKEVRLSTRLTDSPCCVLSAGPDSGMRRIMEAMGQEVPKELNTLEINPTHPLVVSLKAKWDADKTSAQLTEDLGALYDLALISAGTLPRHPSAFAQLLAKKLA